MRSALLTLFVAAAVPLFADDVLLLPVTPSTINGALGSSWHTALFEWNEGATALTPVCVPEACTAVPGGSGVIVQANSSGRPAFVYVTGSSNDLRLALRTTEFTSGTPAAVMEVPVVSTSAFRGDLIRIQGV